MSFSGNVQNIPQQQPFNGTTPSFNFPNVSSWFGRIVQPIKENSTLFIVAAVVTGVMTLGIICYKIVTRQDRIIRPYSALGQEALSFARKKLEENPEIAPQIFRAGWFSAEDTLQPINQEIARLRMLKFDAYNNLEGLLKQNKLILSPELCWEMGRNPWGDEEVIKAADEYIKISYAVSNLTLDDLNLFTALHNKTYVAALTDQDAYLYRTFYDCTNAYHLVRGEMGWLDEDCYPLSGEGRNRKPYQHFASSYYEKGTIQNSWNELYNEYCDRVRLYVDEKELRKADQRHVIWTKKDEKPELFSPYPGTQPT